MNKKEAIEKILANFSKEDIINGIQKKYRNDSINCFIACSIFKTILLSLYIFVLYLSMEDIVTFSFLCIVSVCLLGVGLIPLNENKLEKEIIKNIKKIGSRFSIDTIFIDSGNYLLSLETYQMLSENLDEKTLYDISLHDISYADLGLHFIYSGNNKKTKELVKRKNEEISENYLIHDKIENKNNITKNFVHSLYVSKKNEN